MAKTRSFRAKSFNTNLLSQRQRRLERLKKVNAAKKLKAFIRSIPKIINGTFPANSIVRKKIYNSFWSAVVLSIFEDIHAAYEEKSNLNVDELGNKWADLSPYTKAYHRSRRGHLTKQQRRKLSDPNTIGMLSPAQYKDWKKTFAKSFQRFTNGGKLEDPAGIEEAKRRAAAVAWITAKAKGAETLLGVMSEKDMLVMRVTDTIFKSLRPGKIVNNKYRKGDRNQVIRMEDGEAEIGTKVSYAKMAEGPLGPRHRKLWPDRLGIWYSRAIEKGRDALAEVLKEVTK